MRFKLPLVPWFAFATAQLATSCIDVTCAERGTCAPSETPKPDAAATEATSSNPGSAEVTETSAPLGASSAVSDASSPCYTSCSSADAAVSAPDAASSSESSDAATSMSSPSSSNAASTDSDACVVFCDCDVDGCEPPVEAGPRTCSEDEAAACVSPASICVFQDDAPLCVECRNDDDCSAPTGVCIATRCEVCDLVSNDGCSSATPFCVAANAAVDDDSSGEGTNASDAGAAAARSCVECRNNDDCGGDTPLCDEGSCVQCVLDTDCTSPDAPRCDTAANTCTGCNAPGQCSRFGETPACNAADGTCVECTAAERDACDEFACKTTPGEGQYTCSEQEVGSATQCGTCVSDAACGANMACVLENFGGQPTEWVCLPKRPQGGCARPLIGLIEDGISADSQDVEDFCKPANASCAAYRDYGQGGAQGSEPCEEDADCGLEGVADGLCVPYPNTSFKLCTYRCLVSFECPGQCAGPQGALYCSLQ